MLTAATRLPSLGVCLAMLSVGCGWRPLPTSSVPHPLSAPRQIQLPPDIRPLRLAEPSEEKSADTHSAPAQFQQSLANSSADARIVEFSSTKTSPAGTIKEPLAAASSGTVVTPSAPPRRSEFVPITFPDPPASPQTAAVPNMPVQAQFSVPQPSTSGLELATPNRDIPTPNQRQSPEPTAVAPATASSSSISGPLPHEIQAPQSTSSFVSEPAQPAISQFQSQPSGGMVAATQRAMQMANQASTMAQRGMLFSAKTELVKALTLVSQALDMQEVNSTHLTSLSAGLIALREARDFSGITGRESGNVAVISATHRTALPFALRPDSGALVAQQQYFAYAQSELIFAAGYVPTASEILYRLGRLETAMAAHDTDPQALHGPQSIVFHQAALTADANNWRAANELGVIYARFGQLPEARQFLIQSITIHPHREGWHNLAVVHQRLGETELARRAEAERQTLERQPGAAPSASEMVRWVDPKTFAATGGGDVNWPATIAAKPTSITAKR